MYCSVMAYFYVVLSQYVEGKQMSPKSGSPVKKYTGCPNSNQFIFSFKIGVPHTIVVIPLLRLPQVMNISFKSDTFVLRNQLFFGEKNSWDGS
jgi:hypothetical protein